MACGCCVLPRASPKKPDAEGKMVYNGFVWCVDKAVYYLEGNQNGSGSTFRSDLNLLAL